jgi:hypothetical protein
MDLSRCLASSGAPIQPYFSTWLAPFRKRVDMPPPPPDAPTGFRFAKPGSLSQALSAAGFRDVAEQPRTIRLSWPGTADELWTMQREIVPQLLARFKSALVPAEYEAAKREAGEALSAYQNGGSTLLDLEIHVVTGVK